MTESKIKNSFYLMIVASVLIFVVLSIISQKQCSKKEKEIHKFFLMIDSVGSVDHITLSKSIPGWEINLVNGDVEIKELSTIDSIRNFIMHKQFETWQKPIAEWEALLIFYFVNGERFDMRIRKLQDAKAKNRTHIYFQIDPSCGDTNPSYSDELGVYLEKIVKYHGRKFR